MRYRLMVLGALAALALAAQPAAARGPKLTPKQKDIRRLLVLSGSGKIGVQVYQQVMPQFRTMPSFRKVPDKLWRELERQASPDDLIDLIVPVYDRHLNHSEVKAIIAFYQTPAGKKLVSVMPVITQESMVAGRQWGQQVSQRIIQRLQKEGFK